VLVTDEPVAAEPTLAGACSAVGTNTARPERL
jgi:hypothetical protein